MQQDSERTTRRWVINLCALAAPMVIPQPRASRLTRFRFFLSHYHEAGRRKYRLRMGYFDSVAEAEKWLATLRKVYPRAFVSETSHAQPDLMSNTQTLRILQLGRVANVRSDADRWSEIPSGTPRVAQEQVADGKQRAALGKPNSTSATLAGTLEELRLSEFNMDGDGDPSSTGVRHLRVEVQRRPVTTPHRRNGSHTPK